MNKNLSLFIIGMATLFWFKGMYKILDYMIPDELSYHILLALIGLSIFYLNDGELNELGSIESSIPQTKKIQHNKKKYIKSKYIKSKTNKHKK
jgi:hypothetical protein